MPCFCWVRSWLIVKIVASWHHIVQFLDCGLVYMIFIYAWDLRIGQLCYLRRNWVSVFTGHVRFKGEWYFKGRLPAIRISQSYLTNVIKLFFSVSPAFDCPVLHRHLTLNCTHQLYYILVLHRYNVNSKLGWKKNVHK